MKMTVSMDGPIWVARFVEGPRRGFYASENIGTPLERPLNWPDRESVLLWMQWQGHTEYKFDAVGYLKERDTRDLMGLRAQCYKFPFGMDLTDYGGGMVITIDQINAELATREHIPNKAEAKKLRQERAHQQRTR